MDIDIDRTYFSSAAQKLFQGFEAHHKSKRVSASREMLKSKFDNNSMLHSYRLGLLSCITRHIISRQMNVTQENQSEQHVENTLNESSQQFGSVQHSNLLVLILQTVRPVCSQNKEQRHRKNCEETGGNLSRSVATTK